MGCANFAFLKRHWQPLAGICCLAEQYLDHDPASALVKMRIFAESFVVMIYKNYALTQPEPLTLWAQINSTEFRKIVPSGVIHKIDTIRRWGNKGAHPDMEPLEREFLVSLLEETHDLARYMALRYAGGVSISDLPTFNAPAPAASQDAPATKLGVDPTLSYVGEISRYNSMKGMEQEGPMETFEEDGRIVQFFPREIQTDNEGSGHILNLTSMSHDPAMPIGVLGLDSSHSQALERIGIEVIGDFLKREDRELFTDLAVGGGGLAIDDTLKLIEFLSDLGVLRRDERPNRSSIRAARIMDMKRKRSRDELGLVLQSLQSMETPRYRMVMVGGETDEERIAQIEKLRNIKRREAVKNASEIAAESLGF